MSIFRALDMWDLTEERLRLYLSSVTAAGPYSLLDLVGPPALMSDMPRKVHPPAAPPLLRARESARPGERAAGQQGSGVAG